MKPTITTAQSTSMAFAHQQVALALNPRLMQPLLRSVSSNGASKGAPNGSLMNGCNILDAKYEPGKCCSILYEVNEEMIIGELTWPSAAYKDGNHKTGAHKTGNQESAEVSALLPTMQLYPFESDPGLPTLTTVMDGKAMQRILNEALPECAAGTERILRCRVTLLRYRLGKRCTLRYDLRLRATQSGTLAKRTLFGKLYHSAAKAEAVYHEMQMLADAQNQRVHQNLADSALSIQTPSQTPRAELVEARLCLRQAQAAGLSIPAAGTRLPSDLQNEAVTKQNRLVVARAVAYIPSLPMVLQAPVEDSAPLELLLLQPPNPRQTSQHQTDQLASVTVGICSAAAALAELHQSSALTDRVRSVDTELEKLEKRSQRIADVDVTTGADLHRLSQALLAGRGQLHDWGEEITVVHGDCKPSQFFLLPDGEMALLDFDHFGMADPAADVGNFLATLRQMGVKQILKQRDPAVAARWQRWLATLEEAFLTEYMASRPCHADFRRRAVWYQAMALLRKALRSFARSTHSPLPSLLVREAWCMLESC